MLDCNWISTRHGNSQIQSAELCTAIKFFLFTILALVASSPTSVHAEADSTVVQGKATDISFICQPHQGYYLLQG